MARDRMDGQRSGPREPENEELRIRIRNLFKRCHANALGNKAASVKTDVDRISALLSECRDAVIGGNVRRWPKDFAFKVGDPVFLVGKMLDGRIIRSNDPIPLSEDPTEFLKALENFLNRVDSTVSKVPGKPEREEKPREERGLLPPMKIEGREEAAREEEAEETWWNFGYYSREERRILERIFNCQTTNELAQIPPQMWKDDERIHKHFFRQANVIFLKGMEEAETAKQLIDMHSEIKSFMGKFTRYLKDHPSSPYRDPIVPDPEHQAIIRLEGPLVERVTGFLTQYIHSPDVTMANLSAISRALEQNEWIYTRDDLRSQVEQRMTEIRFKPQPRR